MSYCADHSYLQLAVLSLRFDLLDYLESQGIGQTALRLLRNEGEQSTEHDWSCFSIPQMLQHLIELGAPIEKPFFGGNAIHSSMWKMLSILIKHGVGRHDLGVNGLTPSMLARVKWHWAAWCEALERNNLRIEDVLEKEANTWLLDDNWKVVWRDRLYFRWEYLDTNFVDDIPDIHPVSRWVTK
ncbi:hypothetical protein SNOG_15039 [Parastagonospora nodorum SN15]|uniref:Uncharacterized protein n=1 Tax=Phaeosphaeria nodorum (strain SN15 / ATCC MYA-4574 / FGSC 10173) TaxID=321614 RepID=Q0TZM3_PHANO|nr:hypothetical protein SNOG_15039 [Parastagonospora nodorum SN15]EAT77582.1 hypothetical protein SNOG_15039 [Parastagonospora nodorum SN15]